MPIGVNLHRNDGEWLVIRGEWGDVELLTLTLSFPSNRKRYKKGETGIFSGVPILKGDLGGRLT
jgi:hypothetical protein